MPEAGTLICDSPPRLLVGISTSRRATDGELDRLCLAWEKADGDPDALVLEPMWTLHWGAPARQWPDAEYCAA
jgi:hypothetical protein